MICRSWVFSTHTSVSRRSACCLDCMEAIFFAQSATRLWDVPQSGSLAIVAQLFRPFYFWVAKPFICCAWPRQIESNCNLLPSPMHLCLKRMFIIWRNKKIRRSSMTNNLHRDIPRLLGAACEYASLKANDLKSGFELKEGDKKGCIFYIIFLIWNVQWSQMKWVANLSEGLNGGWRILAVRPPPTFWAKFLF